MVKVLFICLGNICRSPTGEGVFGALVEREGLNNSISVDSAGTAACHAGSSPDSRSQAAARRRGIDMSHQCARQVHGDDFVKFDYLLAMDSRNYADLMRICPDGNEHKIHLMLDFAKDNSPGDVPDPYYSDDGFEVVLDLIEDASRGLLAHIRDRHL